METTGPALEAENRGCLHSFLLAQEFSFSWDFHSLLSPEKKPSSFRMETEDRSRAQLQVVGSGRSEADEGPTAALGGWKRGRTGWSYARAEAKRSTGWVCPGYGKKYTKLIRFPQPSLGKLNTQMWKRLFTEASLPANTWMTSIFLADKFKCIQKCEKTEQTHIKRKGVGRAFRF